MHAEACWLFSFMAGEDGTLDKEELIRAHGGDFKIFEAIDADSSNVVSEAEWREWLHKKHEQKGKDTQKAWKWLRSFVDTLKVSLNVAAHEERRAVEVWEALAKKVQK